MNDWSVYRYIGGLLNSASYIRCSALWTHLVGGWEFSRFFYKGDSQSLAHPWRQANCLPLGLCNETVKSSITGAPRGLARSRAALTYVAQNPSWGDLLRADSRLAPSQWETALQSNAVSHWLGANLESALPADNLGLIQGSSESRSSLGALLCPILLYCINGLWLALIQMSYHSVFLFHA